MCKLYNLLLIFLMTTISCPGQQRILLFRNNRHRTALYKTGDQLTFRLKNDNNKYSFQIIDIEDSLIVFKNYKISPLQISHLYADDKTKIWYIMKYKYGNILLLAGTGYLFVSLINRGEIEKETMAICGSLIAAGVLAKLIIGNKIKIKGKRKLVIVSKP
jgi:hypothetical protein